MYRVRYCPRARSILILILTHLLHARLGYQQATLFSILFFVELGVKVRSISCNIGPAERAISRNMDRSRMSGIGKLHNDGQSVTRRVIILYVHCTDTTLWLLLGFPVRRRPSVG